MLKMSRALISVSDKCGVIEFARGLTALGIEILSTGGTAKTLIDAGIAVVPVENFTGFPEMLDGRVKTLHPRIHAGILHKRSDPNHQQTMVTHGLKPIDLVVVNLYPFEQTVARPDCTFAEAVENIDIGGPSLLRAAAKNHADVGVVVDPDDYPAVLDTLRTNGTLSAEQKLALAKKAFRLTARYDGAIADYLGSLGEGGSECPLVRPCTSTMSKLRTCGTAKIRTRLERSTGKRRLTSLASPMLGNCKGRNCPSTISSMPMLLLSC